MDDPEITQLSFEVGGEKPNVASLKISGGLALARELRKGESVGIRIIDADGQVLAEGDGPVTAVGFKDKRNKYGIVESTERTHTVKAQH
jgi:hypothetical protein